MTLHYDIHTVAPYINWVYFFFAWQVREEAEQRRLKAEAENWLDILDKHYKTHALFRIAEARSDGDDVLVACEDGSEKRLPMLRQQQPDSDCLCLADFIAPHPTIGNASCSQIGIFATSADRGLETDFDADPYQKMMVQLLADRLAEATAERMHEEVRKHYWGYAAAENLSINDMHQEHFQGIRPAVGYPSLPDASLNFLLNDLLDMRQIGISLTESGAMRPHASVSGLMLAHSEARHFAVGKIGKDQLDDYARRRQMTTAELRKFMTANL